MRKSTLNTLFSAAVLALLSGASALRGAEPSAESVSALFTEKVQPIFVKHCYKCHSAEAEKIKGGLLLDSREGLLKGGETGTALVPGDPDNSKLVIAVRHTDPDLRMPPKEKLSDAEIAAIEEWVKAGAPDPRSSPGTIYRQAKKLWSTKPVAKPAVPNIQDPFVRDPIDAFILAELRERKLHPVPPADRRTLIRRASFDLLGLPPTAEQVETFAADKSTDAYAKVVDELLKSPHFGERWGRHWLDVARYADSNGLDQNTTYPNAWRYRDYVIKAFNQDKPYNQFVREQLAGDLLPFKDNEDRHQKWIATGFLMLGPKNFFEPNREKLLMDVADEQIDVSSRAFLGLTVSCARCHDHKFDPIPTRDYYALAGIFRSTQTLTGDARRGDPTATPFTERPLGSEAQAAVVEEYQKKLSALQQKRDRIRTLAKDLPGGIDSKALDGIVVDNLAAEVIGGWKLSNYSTNFVDKNYLHDGNERKEKGKKIVRFVPDLPQDGLYEIRLAYTARPNRATNVPVRVQGKLAPRTVYLNQTVEPKYDKAFETLGFFELLKGTNNTVEVLTEGTKGFVVVDAVQFLPQDVQLAAMFMKKPVAVGDDENMMAMGEVSVAKLDEFEASISELVAKAPPPLPMAMAVREGEPKNTRIHIRGDTERLGEEVPRGFLSVIDHVETGAMATDSSGRLQLAEWIASDRNPLTARVMVNRIWQHLFGRGLVATPDNFGSMGEMPSHPELLDYLAAEFMQNGWSVKQMIRRIMLTSSYQLGTAHDAANHAADPDNRYLWRMNRKRLDAEALRDSILAINGSLDATIGGESVSMSSGNMVPPGDRNDTLTSKRRSIYLPVFRGNLNDLFQVFDFPDPHALAGKRYVTTAPTQSLFLMNSRFMLDEADVWAQRLASVQLQGESQLVERVYAAAFGRPPTAEERDRALGFLKKYSAALVQIEPEEDARKRKTLRSFCQAILESTEFRFLN